MIRVEYSASEIRTILQQIFPNRRLVLSQFTFFNQCGVAKPTGETFRRGRRCYRLVDLLSIATVLALKEEGIPLKNIDTVPSLIQTRAEEIFSLGQDCRLSGYGSCVILQLPGDAPALGVPVDAFLADETGSLLFWSYDVGVLAKQLELVASGATITPIREAVAA